MSAGSPRAAPQPAEATVRVTEIFHSLQGEADSIGWPTVFVRLTGCPLRCSWCDTAYAFHGGRRQTIESVVGQVAGYATQRVTVTGGEPLAQPGCLPLLTRLCDAGHRVSLETSGALDLAAVDPRVVKVMDIKTPASGECARNRWDNLDHLHAADQVKLVISDREDYLWARNAVLRRRLAERCQVLFSPVYERLEPRRLAEWILADRLPVRFQIQLHKLLWGDEPGR